MGNLPNEGIRTQEFDDVLRCRCGNRQVVVLLRTHEKVVFECDECLLAYEVPTAGDTRGLRVFSQCDTVTK